MSNRIVGREVVCFFEVCPAKGYARGENDYVILTDDDLDTVALETVRTIDIEKFVPAESIGWT
ncbi:Ku protein, partial [Rhizobium ruizarguesonis]